MSASTPWAVIPRPRPAAGLRLFCFPHAGGAASSFTPWGAELPPEIELVAVQPPGRERRLAEAPFSRLDDLVEAAISALRPCWDRPFAFLGYSTGALVAYEIARRLRAEGAPGPVHLVACGRWAPHLSDPEPPIYALPEAELLDALRRYQGTPPEVLENRELMELLLPLLRADFSLGDNYRYRAEPPLAIPITALGGLDDPRVSHEALQAWSEHTTGPFQRHLIPGDHFFLHQNRRQVLAVLDATLRPIALAV